MATGRVRLDIEVLPSPAYVANAFFTTAEKCQDLDTPLWQFTEIAMREFEMNFASQGRPSAWEPLSEATLWNRTVQSLSSSQYSALLQLKKDSKFEGELVTGADNQVHFVPNAISKFSMVLSGLQSDMQILVATGALHDGSQSPGNWNRRDFGTQSKSIDLAGPTDYAQYHISGTIHMPIRDWSYVSDEGITEMQTILADWVMSD